MLQRALAPAGGVHMTLESSLQGSSQAIPAHAGTHKAALLERDERPFGIFCSRDLAQVPRLEGKTRHRGQWADQAFLAPVERLGQDLVELIPGRPLGSRTVRAR